LIPGHEKLVDFVNDIKKEGRGNPSLARELLKIRRTP